MSKHDQTSSESSRPDESRTGAQQSGEAVDAAKQHEGLGERATQAEASRRGMQEESLSRAARYPKPETQMQGEGSGRAQRMMTSAVSATEHVGSGFVGGVTHVATDLVHGVGDVGNEVISVVRDTANYAISGVGNIGETAVHTVASLLAGLVGEVKQIGAAATGGGPRTEQRPMESREREEIHPEEMHH